MTTGVVRSTVAVVVAPAIAAILIAVWQFAEKPSLRDSWDTYFPMYFMASYAVTWFPVLFLTIGMKSRKYVRLWQFMFAGFALAFACGLFVAVQEISSALLVFSLIGAVVGGIVWLISEWQPSLRSPD